MNFIKNKNYQNFFLKKTAFYVACLVVVVSSIVLLSCKEKELKAMQKVIKKSDDIRTLSRKRNTY